MYDGMLTGDKWQKAANDVIREIDIAADAPGGGGFDRDWLTNLRTKLTDLFEHVPLAEGTTPYQATVGAGGKTTYP